MISALLLQMQLQGHQLERAHAQQLSLRARWNTKFDPKTSITLREL